MDARENAYVLWFDELRRADVGLVGGKSSSLGELTSSVDVPVPYGYATTASAYRYFMEKTGQNKKIHKMLHGALRNLPHPAVPEASYGFSYSVPSFP